LQQFEGRKRRFPLKAERPHLTRVRLFYWRLHKFRLSSRGLPLVLLLNYAHGFALVLLALSFRLLIATTLLQKRQERRRQTAQFLSK
jgi:hypothetical protein